MRQGKDLHADHTDEALRATATDDATFTPETIAQAQRAARRLHERYRRKTLPECEHALARMYGDASWAALQARVAAGVPPSRSDEDEREDVVRRRREHQRDVALVWLAGVDDCAGRQAQALDAALLTQAGRSISQRHDPLYNGKRLERARYAHHLAYAARVVDEMRPTAREAMPIPADDDGIEVGMRVDLLPRALKSWIAHHRPLLDRWGAIVGALQVRQRCPAELLEFSFTWGELCLQHPVDIPKAVQVYPIALCAQWYAWLACMEAPALRGVLELVDDDRADETARNRARAVLRAAIQDEEARFLLTQPREDFRFLSPSARRQQMHAGHAAVRRYMSEAAAEHTIRDILARPSWLAPAPLLALR